LGSSGVAVSGRRHRARFCCLFLATSFVLRAFQSARTLAVQTDDGITCLSRGCLCSARAACTAELASLAVCLFVPLGTLATLFQACLFGRSFLGRIFVAARAARVLCLLRTCYGVLLVCYLPRVLLRVQRTRLARLRTRASPPHLFQPRRRNTRFTLRSATAARTLFCRGYRWWRCAFSMFERHFTAAAALSIHILPIC